MIVGIFCVYFMFYNRISMFNRRISIYVDNNDTAALRSLRLKSNRLKCTRLNAGRSLYRKYFVILSRFSTLIQ
jgi:hypothetical protein